MVLVESPHCTQSSKSVSVASPYFICARVAAHAHIARRHIYTPRVTLYTRTCEKSGLCHYSVHAVLCSWHTQQQRLENFKRPTPRRPR